jgi:alkyl sulfatase BDS1-like metallo-beta-lactamase superfamily hydrolase
MEAHTGGRREAVRCLHGRSGQGAANEQNDLRFAATLLDHVVAAEPENSTCKEQLAQVYQRLAWGAENAVWRNFYLTAAQNLQGKKQSGKSVSPLSRFHPQSTVENWLDALSLQLNGPRASSLERECAVVFEIAELKQCWMLRLRNAALTYREVSHGTHGVEAVDVTLTLSKAEMYELLAHSRVEAIRHNCHGDFELLRTLLDLCGIVCI